MPKIAKKEEGKSVEDFGGKDSKPLGETKSTSASSKPTKPKATPKAPKESVQVLPKDWPVIYPYISVSGMKGKEIPLEDLKVSVARAKKILGWETEADHYNKAKEKDPTISREAIDFGDDYLLIDEEGNKVRCWNNAMNRPFYPNWAASIAQDILTKHWHMNGETIILSNKGRVLSAQHRLIALVLAGQRWAGKNSLFWRTYWGDEEPYILALVVVGIDDQQETVNTLDNVKPRSLGDAFYTTQIFSDMFKDERKKACNMLQHAVRFLWERTAPSREIEEGKSREDYEFKTHSVSAEFLDRHWKLVDFVRCLLKLDEDNTITTDPIKLPVGKCSAIAYLQGSSDTNLDNYIEANPPTEKSLDWALEQKAKRFWEEISKDTALFKPLRKAMAALLDPESGVEGRLAEKICILAKAWALFKDDMPLSLADIMPRYDKEQADEEGPRKIIEYPTFGGIDYGPPRKKGDSDEEGPTEEEIEEAKKQAHREKQRKEMEEKLKKEGATAKGNVKKV